MPESPGTTSRFALPYPGDSSVPNGPAQFEALAEKVEEALGRAGAQSAATLIPAEQSQTFTTSYAPLGTADAVSGIILPAKGIICVSYNALWEAGGAATARAALFLKKTGGSAQQLRVQVSSESYGENQTEAAAWPVGGGAGNFNTLTTFPGGLIGGAGGVQKQEVPVTTGSALATIQRGGASYGPTIALNDTNVELKPGGEGSVYGGICMIEAEAGTYEVSVQFKHKSGEGTIHVKERRLYVWTQEFV